MSETTILQTDQEARLYEMGAFGFVAIDVNQVILDDMLEAHRQGAIVRCYTNPSKAIRFYPPHDSEALGCVAGWISEGDE